MTYSRYLEGRLRGILAYTPVAGAIGPRQSGKTTLAKMVGGLDLPYLKRAWPCSDGRRSLVSSYSTTCGDNPPSPTLVEPMAG